MRGEGLDVDGMVCHVGKAEHRQTLIDAVIEKDKKLDILVSNAAVNPTFGPMLGKQRIETKLSAMPHPQVFRNNYGA